MALNTKKASTRKVLKPALVADMLLYNGKLSTMGGAYRLMLEDKTGSNEVGKLADLAVLAENPLTCTPDKLRHMNAKMSILGGRIVYEVK